MQQACARWHEERLAQVLGRLPARTTTQLLRTLAAFVAAAEPSIGADNGVRAADGVA